MIGYIEIEGFKSIKKMQLTLSPINILIGSNGSGKSNFVSFFKMVNAISNQKFQQFVAEEKTDNLLHFGRKNTEKLEGKLIFKDSYDTNVNNAYYFDLMPTKENGLFFATEASGYNVDRDAKSQNYFSHHFVRESGILNSTFTRDIYLKTYFSDIKIFHFHDTSPTSYLRRECDINDNIYFKPDGRNLPAFLYLLKVNHPKTYTRIEKTIQTVAPYIDKLILEPKLLNTNEIELRWVDIGDSESSFSAYQLSDGTLRFIALTVLLMQPNPPSVIIIDEPELGLHPFAIGKLAGMIQAASKQTQIIVATQSPGLVNHFLPEDIIIVDRDIEEKQSIFKRLTSNDLASWLEDYSLGNLWERNIINGAQP